MRLISTIFFLLVINFSFSQEDQLQPIYKNFDAIYQMENDQDKLKANSNFKSLFIQYLKSQPKVAMNHGFSDLQMFKGLAPNGMFRIFNWNIPLEDTMHYECLFVLQKDPGVHIIECKKNFADISALGNKNVDHKRWPAALYYDIVPFNKKRKNQFLLLGWDGHDQLTNRKLIEVVSVNQKSIKFGAPIFKEYPTRAKRIIFEYSEEATMSLTHHKKFKRLVFDHLAPSSQNLKGQFQFYGPDMTFDSFVFKKGLLYYRENISFERDKHSKDVQFRNPRK